MDRYRYLKELSLPGVRFMVKKSSGTKEKSCGARENARAALDAAIHEGIAVLRESLEYNQNRLMVR